MNDKQYNQPSAILKITNHFLLILMMILGAAILLIGYFWLIKPKIDSITTQKNQIISAEAKQEQDKRFVDSLKKLEAEYNDILYQRSQDLDKLNKLMPENPQIAELFSLSAKLALASGFEVTALDFSGDFDESTKKDSKTKDQQPVVDNGLRQVIIHLTIQKLISEEGEPVDGLTSYQSFKKYLETLETGLRLMDIQTVSFDSLVEGSEEPSPDVFNFDIITYYRQND